MSSTNVFNEVRVEITLLRSKSRFQRGYVLRCTFGYVPMHIPPPVTAKGFDRPHHPRYTGMPNVSNRCRINPLSDYMKLTLPI